MEVLLVRHTSVDVPRGTCYGWTDVPVRSTFEEEAAKTFENLKPYMPFDKVYSSPLTRAKKLAEFCGYNNPIIDHRLKEMNMGDWEMRMYDEIEINDPKIKLWHNDYTHLSATNGESFTNMYGRVSSFLDGLKQNSFRRVCIFAHGGVLICAGIYGGLFSKENAFKHLVGYGELEKIEI